MNSITEREIWIARYRALEREVTDPLAARLLRDIVSELEAELDDTPNSVIEANNPGDPGHQ